MAYQLGVIVFGLAQQFGSGPGDAGAWATGQKRLRTHDHALAELGCQGGFAGTCRGSKPTGTGGPAGSEAAPRSIARSGI